MKALTLMIALSLSTAALFGGNADDVRTLWLRGEWSRAESNLIRDEARASNDAAKLAAMRNRVLFLLDRNSYSKHDPASVRSAVEGFYEVALRQNDAALQADAIHAMGRYRYWQMFSGEGDWKTVRDLFQRALDLRQKSDDKEALADSHFYLGLVHQMQGEAAPARVEFERGMTYAQSHPFMQSFLERHLGALDEDAGNHELANRRYAASVELRRRSGAALLVPFALNLLASHEESFRKDTKRATQLYRESSALAKKTRSNRAHSNAEGELARLAEARGDRRAARKHAAYSLKAARAHGDPELVREALERQKELAK